jgi:hypothetical protein
MGVHVEFRPCRVSTDGVRTSGADLIRAPRVMFFITHRSEAEYMSALPFSQMTKQDGQEKRS